MATTTGRKIERIRCHIRGTLRYHNRVLGARIIDISRLGMALELHEWIDARRGSKVFIQTGEFGTIEGIVCWYRAGKMGIQIHETSNTAAQIAAYFKNHHQRQMAVAG